MQFAEVWGWLRTAPQLCPFGWVPGEWSAAIPRPLQTACLVRTDMMLNEN